MKDLSDACCKHASNYTQEEIHQYFPKTRPTFSKVLLKLDLIKGMTAFRRAAKALNLVVRETDEHGRRQWRSRSDILKEHVLILDQEA